MQSVRLTGMGPKVLLSDASTADHPVLRWRLRVRGNTAVEFGVVPASLPPCHTALHKCASEEGAPHRRATGFCSQVGWAARWGAVWAVHASLHAPGETCAFLPCPLAP